MYGRSRVNVKVDPVQLKHVRVAFHTLPLFHSRAYNLRAYSCKSYATMEIYPYTDCRVANDETASREKRGHNAPLLRLFLLHH